jgi:hypothetical protein
MEAWRSQRTSDVEGTAVVVANFVLSFSSWDYTGLYIIGIRAVDTAFLILPLVSQNWDLGSGHRDGHRWRTRALQAWSWSVFGGVSISFFFVRIIGTAGIGL